MAPQTPERSSRLGEGVALLESARRQSESKNSRHKELKTSGRSQK